MKLLYSLTILLFFYRTKCQVVFTINDVNPNNNGSANVIFPQAEAAANSGQNVIVNMNAPGLIPYGGLSLFLTNGSVTIQKDPLATVTQGFVDLLPFSYNSCIDFNANQHAKITIKNITIKDFHMGIACTAGDEVVIENVFFNNVEWNFCNWAVTYQSTNYLTKKLELKNCLFENTLWGPWLSSFFFHNMTATNMSSPRTVNVTNNHFKSGGYLQYYSDVTVDDCILTIDGNYSTNHYIVGTAVTPYPGNPHNYLYNDHKTRLVFENNLDIGYFGFANALNNWKIENNTFDKKGSGGSYFSLSNAQISNGLRPYKVSMVNNSPPYCNNQTFLNGNNTFVQHTLYPNAWYFWKSKPCVDKFFLQMEIIVLVVV